MLYLTAVSWPFFYGQKFVKENYSLIATWSVGCILMSTFTLLPAMKVDDSNLMSVRPTHFFFDF